VTTNVISALHPYGRVGASPDTSIRCSRPPAAAGPCDDPASAGRPRRRLGRGYGLGTPERGTLGRLPVRGAAGWRGFLFSRYSQMLESLIPSSNCAQPDTKLQLRPTQPLQVHDHGPSSGSRRQRQGSGGDSPGVCRAAPKALEGGLPWAAVESIPGWNRPRGARAGCGCRGGSAWAPPRAAGSRAQAYRCRMAVVQFGFRAQAVEPRRP